MKRHSIVPVIMFHSVGLEKHNWVFSHISEPLEIFEEKIYLISKLGYSSIFWNELYMYMKGDLKLPKKSIMLTFDDGYLDNWVYAYPILKKYGVKATIFINPEFVDPSTSLRPNLEDVWAGKISFQNLKPAGFLSWTEMREMERSGLIDIQSHALTHTWYFSSSKIIDFHRPNDGYVWLIWNHFPERKYKYLIEKQEDLVRYGVPIYTFEKSLIVRRYFEDLNLNKALADFVEEKGGASFFTHSDWKKILLDFTEKYKKHNKINDRIESEEEYKQRVYHELSFSKKIIEENLNKEVKFLCFPGGGYNDIVLKLAKEAGYIATTLSSKDRSTFRNKPGVDPSKIKRISSATWCNLKGKRLGYAKPKHFISHIESHKGSIFHKILCRIYKLEQLFMRLL